MRALTYRGTQRGQAVSHGRSGRLSLQLSQPAPPSLLTIPQGKAGTPISEGEIGTWWSISFSRSLWEVEPGLGLPSCLPSGPPPLPRGCLGTSGWARSASVSSLAEPGLPGTALPGSSWTIPEICGWAGGVSPPLHAAHWGWTLVCWATGTGHLHPSILSGIELASSCQLRGDGYRWTDLGTRQWGRPSQVPSFKAQS